MKVTADRGRMREENECVCVYVRVRARMCVWSNGARKQEKKPQSIINVTSRFINSSLQLRVSDKTSM